MRVDDDGRIGFIERRAHSQCLIFKAEETDDKVNVAGKRVRRQDLTFAFCLIAGPRVLVPAQSPLSCVTVLPLSFPDFLDIKEESIFRTLAWIAPFLGRL